MEPSPFQDLAYILKNELPSLKGNLTDNISNLAKVADFCEDNYLNCSNHDKSRVYEETKNYAIQAVNNFISLALYSHTFDLFLVSERCLSDQHDSNFLSAVAGFTIQSIQ